MRRLSAIAYAFAFCVTVSPAVAGGCANPNALGTSRTLVIDTSHPRLGAQQYGESLPLADREVVLTFDDGPLAPYTNRILDLLAAECVKATYFLVGRMAQSSPELVRRIQKDGHTIGTHSLSHPFTFDSMAVANAEREIDGGIAAVKSALGGEGKLAPFFRIPGLARSSTVENSLAERSLVTWSVDLVADDWHRHISSKEIAQRALRRLEARGRGILLLHDIQPATALAMPAILKGLKERGFRVVHVVPAGPGRPKTYSEPQHWAAHGRLARSRMAILEPGAVNPRLPVPSRESLGVDYATGERSIAVYEPKPDVTHVLAAAGDMRLPPGAWPREDRAVVAEHMAPRAPGVDAIDWPNIERIASLVSTAEVVWPMVKPARAVEPPRTAELTRKKTKTAGRNKSSRTAASTCKAGETGKRCKKPVGHQLSLNRDALPPGLRSQYSF